MCVFVRGCACPVRANIGIRGVFSTALLLLHHELGYSLSLIHSNPDAQGLFFVLALFLQTSLDLVLFMALYNYSSTWTF